MEFVDYSTLARACRILFGLQVSVNHIFLRYLRPSRVKTAFRKKALLTHPDRLVISDEKTRGEYTSFFIETKWAYEHLRNFCKHRDRGSLLFRGRDRVIQKPHRTLKKQYQQCKNRERPKTFDPSWYYTGQMPQRELLFGEFLFYSQIITWDEFIRTIFMQRKGRPCFGDIARRWNYLSEDNLETIISGKKYFELIGETASRMDIMNQLQVKSVLYYQRRIQRPIGQYFMEGGYVPGLLIDSYLQRFHNHNKRFPARGRF